MAATIAGVFPPETQNLIEKSKILLVGAGGIGCEVLKNLVLMGFGELEVIDLDTIEVSNLNRQFLFNKESVGKPKSIVARESVLKFNPNVIIKSHFGDIMDQKYGTAFFNKFKLVINALDNKKARSHVNRMCLSCDIPLIESGTMGYDGQVELIKKGLSACYECYPRQEPKSYPMCTIRNTPKEPIHCIIWSKFLFSQLFGDNSEEDVSMEENAKEGQYCGTKISAREWAKQNDYNSKKLFKKIFFDDIQYLMSMPDLFEGKSIQPVPLDKSLIDQQRFDYSHVPDNKLMDLSQYVTMFLDCVDIIKEKLLSSGSHLIWDKDDDNFMNFVVASTNIRSAIFNIPFKTHFDIKSMAGNIVPAIATANAIVAGQIVIHALRILKGKFENCQSVFLRSKPNHKGGMLVKDKVLTKPCISCVVCSTEGEIILSTDINKFTVRQFEDLVLKKKLNMVLPDAMVDGRMIISSDEEDKLDLYNCMFSEVGITHGSRFTVDDYFQNYGIKIMLHHKERTHEEEPEFEVFGNLEDLKKQSEIPEPKSEDDDCLMDNDTSEVKAGDVSNTNNEVTAKEMVDVKQGLKPIDNGEEMDVSNEYEVCGKEKIMVPIDEQVSNEEILATKRKAEDNEEVCESKKVRSDE